VIVVVVIIIAFAFAFAFVFVVVVELAVLVEIVVAQGVVVEVVRHRVVVVEVADVVVLVFVLGGLVIVCVFRGGRRRIDDFLLLARAHVEKLFGHVVPLRGRHRTDYTRPPPVSIRVYIDGTIHGPDSAVISVFDRGFLYGDSVYEVTRTVRGRPLDLARHLDRLDRSSAAIDIPLFPRGEIEAAVAATLAAAQNAESYIRIIVTRGAGDISLDPAAADRARLIVLVKELALPSDDSYAQGVDVALVHVQRNARR